MEKEPSNYRKFVYVYLMLTVIYAFTQPHYKENQAISELIGQWLGSFVIFTGMYLVVVLVGCVGGAIYKLKNKTFPIYKILYSSLITVFVANMFLTVGAWYAVLQMQ